MIALADAVARLPKAELHVHLEGSVRPETIAAIASRHGLPMTAEKAAAHYEFEDFAGFIEAYKWVYGYLKTPSDFASITQDLAEELIRQNVVYAEVTISAGVMLRFAQNVEANMAAIQDAALRYRTKGLKMAWILDAARQFGGGQARKVAEVAVKLRPLGVVAFGLGGDELAAPTADFRSAFELAQSEGLHVVAHAGEIGPPKIVRESIDMLGAERLGHAIALAQDPALADHVATRRIPVEICLTSNLRTGALAKQTKNPKAKMKNHPLPKLLEHGITVTLGSDDPAIFKASLLEEYWNAISLGLTAGQIARILEAGFSGAFLPPEEKRPMVEKLRAEARALGIL